MKTYLYQIFHLIKKTYKNKFSQLNNKLSFSKSNILIPANFSYMHTTNPNEP